MNDALLVGLLVAIAIAFIIMAFRRLPSFSFRSDDARQSNGGKKAKKTTVVKTSLKTSSPATAEAMSVNDEYRFNFRNARWGMTRDQVKRSDDFPQPKFEDASRIVYSSRLGHMDCNITFIMNAADELRGGRYDFTTVYEDGARYLSDFETLLELYKERFGDPIRAEAVWGNRTFEKKKEFHGLAFMEGHFSQSFHWQTPRTAVVLFLGKEQEKIDFYIEYTWLEPKEATAAEDATPSADEASTASPEVSASMPADTATGNPPSGHSSSGSQETGTPSAG